MRDMNVAALHYIKYVHHLAREEIEAAEASLGNLVDMADVYPAGLEDGVWLDVAMFDVLFRQNLESAKSNRKKVVPNGFTDKSQLSLVDAAIAIFESDYEAGKSHIETARSHLPNVMLTGVGQIYVKLLTQLEGKCP